MIVVFLHNISLDDFKLHYNRDWRQVVRRDCAAKIIQVLQFILWRVPGSDAVRLPDANPTQKERPPGRSFKFDFYDWANW
jgi:hypothetical protein